MRTGSYILLLLCICRLSVGQTGEAVVKIIPVFNGQPLVLGKQNYVTPASDTVCIDVFRFYISNIVMEDERGKKITEKNSYHLTDAENSGSLSFSLNGIKPGRFRRIHLCIGVDSLANVSGALDGALDPTNGMYWAWNSGYIAAKLEGRSNSCKTLHHAFEFHVGGYLPPFNSLRKVTIDLDPAESGTITLNADAAAWFGGPETIRLSKLNSVVMPGKEAMIVADNYAKMLHLQKSPNPQ